MKSSVQYAKSLRDVYKQLRRKYGEVKSSELTDPVEEMLLAILWQQSTQKRAASALKEIVNSMVDFNELRVSRPVEIEELIGKFVPDTHQKALRMTTALNWLFARHNTLELDQLRQCSETELKVIFSQIEALDTYSSAAVLVMSFAAHAVPLDDRILDYLREQEAVNPDLDINKAQRFIEQHIHADQAREFFLLIRKHVENRPIKPARKKTLRSKTAKDKVASEAKKTTKEKTETNTEKTKAKKTSAKPAPKPGSSAKVKKTKTIGEKK